MALSAQQKSEFKTLLEQQKQAIEARLSDMQGGKSRVEFAHEIIEQRGSVERQHSSDREVDLAISDKGVVELARINAALEKLEQGSYGECEECGCDIPVERLKLEPATQHCVQCKSRWEQETGAVPASNL